ncbi:MAG: sulfite exporter TauE/SafE family protein, partial [Acidobacteriota bacterium]
LGLGGGIIVVPVVALFLGIDIRLAIGASIISVIATSSGAAAAYVRERMANLRVAMFLELGTTLGAISGAYIAGYLHTRWLFLLFGLLIGYSAVAMLRKSGHTAVPGIGSGALKVPAMDLAMHLPMKVSTATSNFMIGVTAAASAGLYFTRGQIDPFLAAPVAAGVLAGATIGSRLLGRINSRSIRGVFVVVLLIVSVQMLVKGLR